MSKYKIIKESNTLPAGWEVGDVLEENDWLAPSSRIGTLQAWFHVPNKSDATSPQHTAALLELGVVDELKEWNPRELKDGDKYWCATATGEIEFTWRVDDGDIFARALGNCHQARSAAVVWRAKLLADYK